MTHAYLTEPLQRMKKNGKPPLPETIWVEAKLRLLEMLWNDGLSASECAAKIGCVSRSAVIGAIHRHQGKVFGEHTIRFKDKTTAMRTVTAAKNRALYAKMNVRYRPKPQAPRHNPTVKISARTGMVTAKAAIPPEKLYEREVFNTKTDTQCDFWALKSGRCHWPVSDGWYCGSDCSSRDRYCSSHKEHSQGLRRSA